MGNSHSYTMTFYPGIGIPKMNEAYNVGPISLTNCFSQLEKNAITQMSNHKFNSWFIRIVGCREEELYYL